MSMNINDMPVGPLGSSKTAFLDELDQLAPVLDGITCNRCGRPLDGGQCAAILVKDGSITVSREDVDRYRLEKQDRIEEIRALKAENRDLRQSVEDMRELLAVRSDEITALRTELSLVCGAKRRLISGVEEAIQTLRRAL